jgi:acyl carrier protein
MTVEEILKICPSLSKITFKEIIDILGSDFNPNKTWQEMGLDDLDVIEMIMSLEKRLDFAFPDTLYDYVFGQNVKPINFTEIIRQLKLKELGI